MFVLSITTTFIVQFFIFESRLYSFDVACLRVLKVIASLLSPTAFALGSINFADYERAHVGLRWSNIWRVSFCYKTLDNTISICFFLFTQFSKIFTFQESSGVNFFACLLMMILDTLLYCAIGLYFDKVCLWLFEYIL